MSGRLAVDSLAELQTLLDALGADGWLLYDFRGSNPVAHAMLGREIVGTRRLCVWVPRTGTPTALVHAVDWKPWVRDVAWPIEWRIEPRNRSRSSVARTHGTETTDDRDLIAGVGFSIGPDIYLPDQVGVRSEVNAFVGDGSVTITPREFQRDLIVR